MENLETGKDKIKQICEVLTKETLRPAKAQAEQILAQAQEQANQIVRDAQAKAASILQDANVKLEKERELFDNSLKQAARQGIETLKQDIENKLFDTGLADWIDSQTVDPQLGAKLVSALVEAIQKEGTSADFSAVVPKAVNVDAFNAALAKDILDKLREKSVMIGDFSGGIALKLHDRNLVLDMTDEALKELLGHYLRKSFRVHLFQAQ